MTFHLVIVQVFGITICVLNLVEPITVGYNRSLKEAKSREEFLDGDTVEINPTCAILVQLG